MNICKDCLCYNACHYHIDEETGMTVEECSTGFKHKDRYTPAYIDQPVWSVKSIRKYENGQFIVLDYEVVKGRVSMLQQKADKSWKIRVTLGHSAGDYTLDEFNEYLFTDLEAAETECAKRISQLNITKEESSR